MFNLITVKPLESIELALCEAGSCKKTELWIVGMMSVVK